MRTVGNIHTLLQHLVTTHGSKTVEIDTDYQISIIGKQRSKLIVNIVWSEDNLIKLGIFEVEVVVSIVIKSGSVSRIIYRTIGLYQRLASEDIRRSVIFGYSDVEIAYDTLILLKMQIGPLPLIDKLLQLLLQFIKHTGIRSLYLRTVDGYLGIEFLSLCRHCRQHYHDVAHHHHAFHPEAISPRKCPYQYAEITAHYPFLFINSRIRIRVSTCLVLFVKSDDSIQL